MHNDVEATSHTYNADEKNSPPPWTVYTFVAFIQFIMVNIIWFYSQELL